jgi:hypothetical protein
MKQRQLAKVLGALAAATALALTTPGSAYAAEGVLIVNGQEYEDPSGCFAIDAEVHSGPGCTGPVEWLVYPGETYYTETAQSVFIL